MLDSKTQTVRITCNQEIEEVDAKIERNPIKISELDSKLNNTGWMMEAKIFHTLPSYGKETDPRHILVSDGMNTIEIVVFNKYLNKISNLKEVSLLSF